MNNFDLTVLKNPARIETISVRSRLDVFSALEFRAQLQNLFEQMVTHLVIDLSRASFVDSTGMAVLISALKQCRQQGGDVRLVMPTLEPVKRVLELVKFDRVFDLSSTVEEAIASFNIG